VTTGSYDNLIKKIAKAGIPMGLFITSQDPPVGNESTVKWWLYNDDEKGGRYVGDFIAPKLPNPAKVCIMRGVYECLWDQGRFAGITAGLRKYSYIETLDVTTGDWDREKGMKRAEEWIARYGDELNGILCLNDEMAWGVYGAAKAAGIKNLVITGWDGATDFTRAVADGTFPVSCDMHWMGYGIQIVDLIFETLKGNPVTPKRNLLKLTLIDKAYAPGLLVEASETESMKKPSTWDSFKLFNYRQKYGETDVEKYLGVEYRVK
jgi:ABC-type sugar transport system substrate-binding protein